MVYVLQKLMTPRAPSTRTPSVIMKKDLHPDYKMITVRLADGTDFQTRSTMDRDEYVSEVDSTNHPFYTGRRQFVDTAGRVEKFNRRYGLKKEE